MFFRASYADHLGHDLPGGYSMFSLVSGEVGIVGGQLRTGHLQQVYLLGAPWPLADPAACERQLRAGQRHCVHLPLRQRRGRGPGGQDCLLG